MVDCKHGRPNRIPALLALPALQLPLGNPLLAIGYERHSMYHDLCRAFGVFLNYTAAQGCPEIAFRTIPLSHTLEPTLLLFTAFIVFYALLFAGLLENANGAKPIRGTLP